MPFEEGHSLSKGRPKGVGNKTTVEARTKMSELLTLALDELKDKLAQLKPSELVEVAALMAKHTIPVPKEDNTDGTTNQVITITGNLLK